MFLYSNRETIELASKLEDIKAAKIALLGVPFDSTETNIPGQRFGPKEIRARILAGRKPVPDAVYDAGDIDAVFGNAKATLRRTEDTLRDIFEKNPEVVPVLLGGEHTVSYAAAKVLSGRHKNLQFLSLDAHYDLYRDYIGERYSHATVMRRVFELLRDSKSPEQAERNEGIFELGVDLKIIGSREKNESAIAFAKRNRIGTSINAIDPLLPTYLSLDLDFFDPKIAPGVSDPENNGFSFDDFKKILLRCKNIVGADIMEFNPMIEKKKTGELAVKCLRELIPKA